jgi:hypothetical protein
MIKATKTTKNRLKNEDFSPRVRIATLLEHIIKLAEVCELSGIQKDDRAYYTNDCLYYLCCQDEVNLFRGLKSRYPNLIEATLTYGLNEIVIPDINKLVKAMLLDR